MRCIRPPDVDCTIGVPENTLPIGDWLKRGFVPAYGRAMSAAERAEPASLLQPAGLYGPSFLATKNYFVIKEYNFSDLYVLFVGHLGDRIADRTAETARSRRHGARSRNCRPPISTACSRSSPRAAITTTRSTAKPAC